MAKQKTQNKLRCINCGKSAKPLNLCRGAWAVKPSCDCNPAAQTIWWSKQELLDALMLPNEKS
jgi:hypothetical protein